MLINNLTTYTSNVNLKELLHIQSFELKCILDFEPEFLGEDQEHHHDNRISSVSWRTKGNVDQMLFLWWIGCLIQDNGYTGILTIRGVDEKCIF